MELVDKLPEIQRKYINKGTLLEAINIVNECNYDFNLVEQKTENNLNLKRYCILVMRYT